MKHLGALLCFSPLDGMLVKWKVYTRHYIACTIWAERENVDILFSLAVLSDSQHGSSSVCMLYWVITYRFTVCGSLQIPSQESSFKLTFSGNRNKKLIHSIVGRLLPPSEHGSKSTRLFTFCLFSKLSLTASMKRKRVKGSTGRDGVVGGEPMITLCAQFKFTRGYNDLRKYRGCEHSLL